MKSIVMVLVLFLSYSAFALVVDFGKYSETDLEAASLDAIEANCSQLFNDGKVVKFISKKKYFDNDEELIKVSVFGWRKSGLTGMLSIFLSHDYEIVDFTAMPLSICR